MRALKSGELTPNLCLVVLHHQRRAVRPALFHARCLFHPATLCALQHGISCCLVVNTPPRVIVKGLSAVGPPRVWAFCFWLESARYIEPFRIFGGLPVGLGFIVHNAQPVPQTLLFLRVRIGESTE